MITFFLNFFRLARPLSNVKNIAIISLAFFLSATPLNWGLFILGSLALSLVFSSIYGYNTVCDADLDKKNDNKIHYSSSIQYFGKKRALFITVILAMAGLIIGFFINAYFFVTLIILILTSFFYSSGYTRFKEKAGLDILFGASLTFLFRFIAAWFIFSISFPPILPMFALVFLKNGGYMLYKGYDKPFLIKSNVKNSITLLSKKTTLALSASFFALSIFLFILLCLNYDYFHVKILGFLPISFLFLLIFFIPPIMIQYLLFFGKIKVKAKYIRIAGLISLFLIIIFVLLISR